MAAREPSTYGAIPPSPYGRSDLRPRESGPANLADILERVLDKGIVIAGDIQINLLEIELLTIKLRLLVASVDRAREMGINWWESDPSLSRGERRTETETEVETETPRELDSGRLEQENRELRERIERLERMLPSGSDDDASG